MDEDQDDRNKLTLFLLRPSVFEREQLSTNCVKVVQLQGHRRTASTTDDISAWNIVVSDDGYSRKLLASYCSTSTEKFLAFLAS